ncbi:tpr domain containing protein [Niveomyces insectorum RCEF 264]|uniref:Tpr domain containing protein n=1 Tax=Niveomyces insectorum RCEF 264 TaxID=1081102 RepID=A0A167M0R1_9HYPO|nr:tpr domain containing protein [Niveomyces insectorum RCEF 264]
MAKTRPGASKKGRSKQSHHSQHPRSAGAALAKPLPPSKPPQLLINEAMVSMTQGDLSSALTAAQKALQALEGASSSGGPPTTNIAVGGVGLAAACALLGEIYLEAGEIDAARPLLERSAALDPDGALPDALGGGIDKFLYLAQISEEGGRDSVAWFERGAAALRARAAKAEAAAELAAKAKAKRRARRRGADAAVENENGGDEDEDEGDDDDEDDEHSERDELQQKLAQVLCAVAEVWMTDLSFEAECEAQCEALTTEATLIAPGAPDVWQTLASVRVSQSRLPDARAALQRSLALWTDLPPDHPAVPAFGVRVGLVRLLLTVEWFDRAADVAMHLLAEDDQAVEVWYLAGYAHYLAGQAAKEEEAGKAGKANDTNDTGDEAQTAVRWQTCWRDARRCLGRCLRRFRQQAYEDEPLGQHAAELLAEVVAAVGPAPAKEEEEKDYEDEDEDDGWEDDDGGEDEDDDNEDEDEEMA